MLLLSTANAWDLGYLGRAELAARSRNVFDSMQRLSRYRGHFLNWYETRHLAPLEPRYVSTVDSGNLALALLAYAETLRDIEIFASENGSRAAAEFTVHGTYLATDAGLPAAHGQTYVLPAGAFFDVAGGKITRITTFYNLADWVAQVSA